MGVCLLFDVVVMFVGVLVIGLVMLCCRVFFMLLFRKMFLMLLVWLK